MSNLYESSSYNIESVYKSPTEVLWDADISANINYNYYTLIIQRLPTSTYPETTEVELTNREVSPDLSVSDWIAQALPVINTRLAAFDSSFDGTPAVPIDTANLTLMFNE